MCFIVFHNFSDKHIVFRTYWMMVILLPTFASYQTSYFIFTEIMEMRRPLSIISIRNNIPVTVEFQINLTDTLMLFIYSKCRYLYCSIALAMCSQIYRRF